MENKEIIIEKISNEQEILDYLLSLGIFSGSLGFLSVGISSYLKYNLLPFLNADKIVFFPQGVTMSFYGMLGIIISLYQLITLYLAVGQGYNEYNKEKGMVIIYRKGYPGKNKNIYLTYKIEDIVRIKKLFRK